jgi:hypothetical protein
VAVWWSASTTVTPGPSERRMVGVSSG